MIPYEVRRKVYEAAIATNGIERQVIVSIEEMAELTKELAKSFRPGGTSTEKLVDEIVDVAIMLEQLRLIFDVDMQVLEHRDVKVRRLADRIGMQFIEEG